MSMNAVKYNIDYKMKQVIYIVLTQIHHTTCIVMSNTDKSMKM